MNKILLLLLFLAIANISLSQNIWKGFEHLFTPVSNYVVCKTEKKISIDGEAIESDWNNAAWSEFFKDIEGELKPEPVYQTRFKMLWDNQNLYILAELEEPNIWAYYNTHDQIVYHENDFEVFIDPDRDTHNYFEFEINAQNTLFDLFLPKPYRNGGKPDIKWNAKGFKSEISISGTLNNPNDRDNMWTVEMAIPFASLSVNGQYEIPTEGDIWKMNFSRVQWQTEVINGNYIKKKNPVTDKLLPENNWVWSTQGVVNMHYPERWGLVLFSSEPAKQKPEIFLEPQEEKLVKFLWLIYYKQKHYFSVNGAYASELSEIGIPDTMQTDNQRIIFLKLKTAQNTFLSTLGTENDAVFKINQDGLIQFTDNKK